MKPRAQARDLAEIAADIRERIETVGDIIAIGGLLREAKLQLRHGTFRPWLKSEFDFSERTARNYMRAHRFTTKAAKSATVADLKLTPTGLYALADGFFSANMEWKYTEDEVALVLKEAAENRVTGKRAVEIIEAEIERKDAAEWATKEEARRAAEQKPEESEEETDVLVLSDDVVAPAVAAEAAEAAALLDAGSELPSPEPAPQASPRKQAELTTFEEAIKSLRSVMTKPASEFKPTYIPATDLQTIADFLRQVAAEKGAAV